MQFELILCVFALGKNSYTAGYLADLGNSKFCEITATSVHEFIDILHLKINYCVSDAKYMQSFSQKS